MNASANKAMAILAESLLFRFHYVAYVAYVEQERLTLEEKESLGRLDEDLTRSHEKITQLLKLGATDDCCRLVYRELRDMVEKTVAFTDKMRAGWSADDLHPATARFLYLPVSIKSLQDYTEFTNRLLLREPPEIARFTVALSLVGDPEDVMKRLFSHIPAPGMLSLNEETTQLQ